MKSNGVVNDHLNPKVRSVPGFGFDNPFLDQLLTGLKSEGCQLVDFKCWKFFDLVVNRSQNAIIHYHWPEAFWRSSNIFVQLLKCIQFVLTSLFARFLGYKLVWSAHNVLPHLNVRSLTVERLMRRFVLRTFDLVVGHARNVESDLLKEFGEVGRRYVLAEHGIYSRETYASTTSTLSTRLRCGFSAEDCVYLLFGGGHERKAKGELEFLRYWCLRPEGSSKLIFKGHLPDDLPNRESDIFHVEGFVSNAKLGELFDAVDFVILPYERITTSGMYFLALTLDKPVIAPNLDFFCLHSSKGSCLLYDASNFESSLGSVLDLAEDGWRPSLDELRNLQDEFSWVRSAQVIAQEYRKL